ncbi:MAG: amidase [Pontixanthobacter sp.]
MKTQSTPVALLFLLASTSAIAGLPSEDGKLSTAPTDNEAAEQLARIDELDDAGPLINAVITVNRQAPFEASDLRNMGPLRGRTVLVKDNIETSEWPTTAGSLALQNNMTGRDATLIGYLRKAGGVVLGKTNLSEWANIRSDNSTSGWSAIGGLTRNPHATDRNSCGSSSGSGAAVAAGFAWAAIGSETDGSITCPASINGIVGFKPTIGVVSRTHVVPISVSQDTAGPMAHSVYDAALLLGAIAGTDDADPVTIDSRRTTDFTLDLDSYSLMGVRIGVMRKQIGNRADVSALFNAALNDLKRAGAVLVDIEFEPQGEMYRDEFEVLLFELRDGMDSYLQSLPGENLPRSLADLVAFNKANADTEMRWFGQETFELALTKTDREAYLAARANSLRLAGPEGIDKLLADNQVEFLIAPTAGPAWTTDLVNGDHFSGGIGMGSLAAISGYPHLTVPMGAVERLPVGISFIGGEWRDHAVLKAGAAYERARTAQLPVPSFKPWSPQD